MFYVANVKKESEVVNICNNVKKITDITSNKVREESIPVKSSMFVGLTSTILKLWLLISKFQRFTRRSSAEMKVSPSLQKLEERYIISRNKIMEKYILKRDLKDILWEYLVKKKLPAI